jgi:hypothetical protein
MCCGFRFLDCLGSDDVCRFGFFKEEGEERSDVCVCVCVVEVECVCVRVYVQGFLGGHFSAKYSGRDIF